MNSKAHIGTRGEEIATSHLREQGFLICARNWRQGRYEIDIVAQKCGVLHFIEVKTRRAGALCGPENSITPNKVAALHKAAAAFLSQHPTPYEIEFDLIAVDTFPDGSFDLRFIPNIAEWGW